MLLTQEQGVLVSALWQACGQVLTWTLPLPPVKTCHLVSACLILWWQNNLTFIAETLVPSRCRAQGYPYDLLWLGGSHTCLGSSAGPLPLRHLEWKMDNGLPTADLPKKGTVPGLLPKKELNQAQESSVRAATQLDWQWPAATHCRSRGGTCLLLSFIVSPSSVSWARKPLSKLLSQSCARLSPVLQLGHHQSHLAPVPLSGDEKKDTTHRA